MNDPVARGHRWRSFWDEDGGLSDMFATIRQTYLERIAKVDPSNVEQLQVLATAHRVTEQVEGMVLAIIQGANVAEAAKEYTTRLQAIPAAKRRYM